MLCFDIGANRGDFTVAALAQGYTVVALEPAPRVFSALVSNFIYHPHVIPLKFAISDTDYEVIEFYEADEDGLSTININWLTDADMPYAGKSFRSIQVTTLTLDTLALKYGVPDLIKIDVEGAEWSVFKGMHTKMGTIAFEWTDVSMKQHQEQLAYLAQLGYTEVGPQFIEHHCQQPDKWYEIDEFNCDRWVLDNSKQWRKKGWKQSALRESADVGMLWVR